MKTIRFKNDWRYSRKGQVIEEGDGVAALLIQRGIAEEVTKEVTEEEQTETDAGGEAVRPEVQTRRIPGPREAQVSGPRETQGRRGRG